MMSFMNGFPEPTVRLLVLSLHLLGRSNFCCMSPTIFEEWKRFSLVPEDHADLFSFAEPTRLNAF